MFNQLTSRLSTTLEKLRGIHRFTEDNIVDAIGDIRKALIEADVALPVIKTFIDSVTKKAIGQTIIKQVRPEDAFVKIVQDELTNDVALAITDFATPETLKEREQIWDNSITYLLSVLGA